MHRRGRFAVVMTLVAVVLLTGFLFDAPLGAGNVIAQAPTDSTAPVAPKESVEPQPIPTDSEFYPESAQPSDCLGFAERPGCGSKARGGWRQSMVFAVVLAGLAVIGWRISIGVRKNRAG